MACVRAEHQGVGLRLSCTIGSQSFALDCLSKFVFVVFVLMMID